MDPLDVRIDRKQTNVAVQDNELIRAAYTMELREKRLLMLAISKIRSSDMPSVGQSIGVELTTEDFKAIFGYENPSRDMRAAAKGLMRRQVTISPNTKTEIVMQWVDAIEYREGRARILFGATISKYLAGMVEQFTQIPLLEISKLNSKHSVRFYEMLKQMEKNKWLTIELDELRSMLCLENKYNTAGTLKKHIIEPSIAELNKQSPWDISVEYVKKGKAVKSVRITYKDKNQMPLEF